eukprot:NODE_11543_length_279_cov_190.714286.p2 GENE.NODE_11543_length_279_cov_190.714286~~NODE_11543_length_279_cov_190.714286.p2  ORF type:complete len:58 (+),score=22.52 NODE_11543_length_279_cov_190.714286:3-176(+)
MGEVERVKAEQAAEREHARTKSAKLIEKTRWLQNELETELSSHFKVPIRIGGEITQI